MNKEFILALAVIAIIILAVIYRSSWTALGRVFQLSFFASLLFIPAFRSTTGYGFNESSGTVDNNLFKCTLAIMGHPFGAFQYGLLFLSLFCAITVLRDKARKDTRIGWIMYIVLDVLFYLILTGPVYDHSHTHFAFG